jgi:diguanylate cyclase (GGDEF)-like protein
LRPILFAGVVCIAIASTIFVLLSRSQLQQDQVMLPWWALAIAYFLCSVMVVHITVRSQAYTITLGEVALVVGMLCADPPTLIAGGLLGSGVALVLWRRQGPLKLLFNLVLFLIEADVAVLVQHQLAGSASLSSTGGQLATLAGAVAGSVLAQTVLTAWLAASAQLARATTRILWFAVPASIVNAVLGIAGVHVIGHDAQAAALLLIPVIALAIAYRGYLGERHKHAQVRRLYDTSGALYRGTGGDASPMTLLAQAREMFNAEVAELLLLSPSAGEEARLYSLGPADDAPLTTLAVDVTDPAVNLARGGSAVLLDAADSRGVLAARGYRNGIGVPIAGERGTAGALIIANRRDAVTAFGRDDLVLLEAFAGPASVSLDNGRLQAELEHQAFHDTLTGLPNRALFGSHLDAALHGGSSAAVLLLDLDRFKEVNDTLGHHNGDLLLQQVGVRLRGALRRGDVVARLGGDEFAVLLPDIEGDQAALQVAKGIVELLEQPFVVEDMSVDVGASIGIAVAPRDGTDTVTLVQRADVAMYTAKSDQTGVEMYSADRDGYSAERLTLASDLRLAVQQRELQVHYQPQVDLRDGGVVGMEALVRWRHPIRGMVYPDEFISIAEHTGLIMPLTLFVLDQALAASLEWRRAGHPIRMSVNLSARSLVHPDLVEDVAALLRRHKVPPGGLCLEVTESSIMADRRRTGVTLDALRSLGVVIAVDDFGTGHSSLAYVKHLPVGEIKIDRVFIASMTTDRSDQAIVRTILELARNLDIPVVAEGIEDSAINDMLRDMGCATGQGYLYARPMPQDELLKWLEARRVRRKGVIVPMVTGRAIPRATTA